MPATMAGSRGGIVKYSGNSEGREFLMSLLSGLIDSEKLFVRFVSNLRPKTVTLVVNNACNLRCAHCYLQVKKYTADALDEREWTMFIDSIAASDPELMCLSGKEVFLGSLGSQLLTRLYEAKERHNANYRLGLITNGTLIHQHHDAIRRANPSYFDISLDGLEEDHDAVRGRGAFAAALPNIDWAAASFGERFFINLTLQKKNVDRFVEAIDFLQQRGIRNVSCGFYRPLAYTAPELALSNVEVDQVYERLLELENLSLQQPTSVLFDLDIVNLQPLVSFLRSDWFSLEHLQEDTNGEHYLEYYLRNGLRLEIRLAPYPTGVWKSLRITPEGNYLAAEDTIDTSHYAERTIGNVRDFDYDFASLQSHALASIRFKEIIRDYYDKVLPSLVDASRQRVVLARAA